MRRLILSLAAVAALVCGSLSCSGGTSNPPAGSDGDRLVGIAFYNLENLFDTINANGKYDLEFSPNGSRKWDSDKYWKKINNLSYAISRMTTSATPSGPAIIGISEVENRSVVEDLVKTGPLRNRNLRIVHHDSPDSRGIDVALLFDPSMFEVLDVTNTPLREVSFATRDQMCVTGVLLGTDTISFIVNHWPSRLGGEVESRPNRVAAARLSKHLADSLWAIRPNQHVIIMGDLNDDPMDYSCAVTLGATKKAKDAQLHGFFNPWWSTLLMGTGTLSYKGRWNLFDQIIVSGTLIDNKKHRRTGRLAYDHNWVMDFDFLQNPEGSPYEGTPLRTYAGGEFLNGYSDHFPTQIFLRLTNPK